MEKFYSQSGEFQIENRHLKDLPGSTVDTVPANAAGTGSIPGLGRFHMHRSNKACTPQLLEPLCLQPVLHKGNHCNERPAPRKEDPAHPETNQLNNKKQTSEGNSLAVQWLGLHTSTAEDTSSIPGWDP